MTKEISLTQGKFALVDDADFEHLNQWKWHVDKKGYARRTEQVSYDPKTGKAVKRNIAMHRQIMGFPDSQIDHRDQNPFNNQRENLRKATQSQNNANRSKQKNNPNKFKGVHRHPRSPKWQASIRYNRRSIYLGMFECPKSAAAAYNKKATELFGEFASLNEIL